MFLVFFLGGVKAPTQLSWDFQLNCLLPTLLPITDLGGVEWHVHPNWNFRAWRMAFLWIFLHIYIYIYRCIHIKLFYMYIQGIFSFIYSHVLHLLSRFRKGKISASSIGIFARLTAFAVLNSRCVAATGERQCNAFANKSQPHWKQNPESTFFRQRVLKAKIFKEKLSALKTSLVCLTINH